MDTDDSEGPSSPLVSLVALILVAVLLGAGLVSYLVMRPRPGPPPAEIADDPVLVEGREIFLARCASCHGPAGKGDGPVAKSLTGPPPGDLTDAEWKHGGRPDQVAAVVAKGVPGTNMAGWSVAYNSSQIQAVTEYVLYLSGRRRPESVRGAETPDDPGLSPK